MHNKILRTPPPHIISTEEISPSLVAPLSNSEQINHPFSTHTYTKSMPNYIHYQYAPFVTLTHTIYIISSTTPTYKPRCHPGFLDRPHRRDGSAGQIDGEDGRLTTRVKGLCRQQQQHIITIAVVLSHTDLPHIVIFQQPQYRQGL